MIHIERQAKWEYKQVIRNLDEPELKALGEQGWEMTGLIQQPPLAYFYFKRPVEK